MKVLRRILKGDLSAFTAYMTGQMTIEGDIQAATDLTKLIDYIK
jgi:putative sterol carrier protein